MRTSPGAGMGSGRSATRSTEGSPILGISMTRIRSSLVLRDGGHGADHGDGGYGVDLNCFGLSSRLFADLCCLPQQLCELARREHTFAFFDGAPITIDCNNGRDALDLSNR